jgi:hypothetical protein
METPAAASSTAPKQINMTKLAPKAIKNQFKTGRGYCKRCFQNSICRIKRLNGKRSVSWLVQIQFILSLSKSNQTMFNRIWFKRLVF